MVQGNATSEEAADLPDIQELAADLPDIQELLTFKSTVGVGGPTGTGKSTLHEHLAGHTFCFDAAATGPARLKETAAFEELRR
jgi:hypothetical protein